MDTSGPALSLESSLNLPSDADTSSSSAPSRPESSASTHSHSSRPTLSAASDIQMLLGASSPPPGLAGSCKPSSDLINLLATSLKNALPLAWVAIADWECVHIFLMSATSPKAVQREIQVFYDGRVTISVHCEVLLHEKVLTLNEIPPLNEETNVSVISEKCLKIVQLVMSYEICVGANHMQTRNAWCLISDTYVDLNPYREDTYSETCRSMSCHRLVKIDKSNKKSRCASCFLILKSLRKREESLNRDTPSPFTPNIHLTLPQALEKMTQQHEEIRKKDKRIAYLEKRVQELIELEGMDVEEDVSNDLHEILKKADLTPIQQLFLEEQLKAAGKKNPRSRRWHPTLIRLALHIRMQSPTEALRDSGAIILPTSRTLFDYSHAITPTDGISEGIMKIVEAAVKKKTKEFQKYHNLLLDEVYISKNLVWRQSDNALFGYAHMDDVEKEIQNFDKYVEERFTGKQEEEKDPELAKTMLAFMVKGVATDIKYVVAAFPMSAISSDAIYVRNWQVISRLEKAGVKVLAVICDGASVNRTFIGMHTPYLVGPTKSMYCTKNFCSPEGRPLFFIPDVCHILKTVRNCFYNSGEDEKKPRCMEINGELIVWKHIVRLYMKFKDFNFRKSFKLNALNVFPNPFSCMKVKPAAQVLSDTVANDIEDQNWPGTKELVRFIRYFNKWFDCLNTAYKDQGTRKKNPNLHPYSDVNDVRFSWLGVPNPGHEKDHGDEMPFLEYLNVWKKQVDCMPIPPAAKEKKRLSWQAFHSLEAATRGFAAAVRYMLSLKEPPKFVLGRAFSQDPLEHHFSLQRAGCGGSRNPNALQFLTKQHSIALQRDIGVKPRGSNVEAESGGMKITEEPLPKRARTSKKK